MSITLDIWTSPALPNLRLINAVSVLARIAARHGIDEAALLQGSGIRPYDLTNPVAFISIRQELHIVDRFVTLTGMPWVGFEVGRDYNFSANGKLGIAAMCCDTVLDALKLVMEYIHLTASYLQYHLMVDGCEARTHLHELIPLGGNRHFFCEAAVTSLKCKSEAVLVKSPFKELHFAYAEPDHGAMYTEYFQCPVYFNAETHIIVFNTDVLATPLPMANPLLRQSMEQECRQLLARIQGQESLSSRVYQELVQAETIFPNLEQVAERINVSSRTLRRQLTKENTSFQAMLANVRKEKALDLLQSTTLSMETIAIRLGFSDASSFYRAFKSWTGHPPGSLRQDG